MQLKTTRLGDIEDRLAHYVHEDSMISCGEVLRDVVLLLKHHRGDTPEDREQFLSLAMEAWDGVTLIGSYDEGELQ